MEKRRVVITGMGTVNPLGNNVEETWESAKNGRSGITRISNFEPENLNSQVAGEVKNFNALEHYSDEFRKTAKKLDSFVHFASRASKEAMQMSGLDVSRAPFRTGICLGTGIGGMLVHQTAGIALGKKGVRGISPMYIPACIGNIAAGFVSMELGIMGPNLATQTACATSNHAMAVAMMMIQSGMADAVLAGGTEASVTEMGVGGFNNMRALSTNFNDSPERASRPYDKNRDGFVIAEGAGVLILEDYEHAKKRGANILAEIASVGMSGDAYDLVAPHPEGNGAYYSMQMAIDMAGLSADQIDYINAHGTSTPLGDLAESKAIAKLVRGDESRLHVGSTKGMHGHLLGATAGVEAVICVKAIQDGLVPPNINIDDFDESLALKPETITTKAVEKDLKVVLSNSFGFGGHNSSAVFKKFA